MGEIKLRRFHWSRHFFLFTKKSYCQAGCSLTNTSLEYKKIGGNITKSVCVCVFFLSGGRSVYFGHCFSPLCLCFLFLFSLCFRNSKISAFNVIFVNFSPMPLFATRCQQRNRGGHLWDSKMSMVLFCLCLMFWIKTLSQHEILSLQHSQCWHIEHLKFPQPS